MEITMVAIIVILPGIFVAINIEAADRLLDSVEEDVDIPTTMDPIVPIITMIAVISLAITNANPTINQAVVM